MITVAEYYKAISTLSDTRKKILLKLYKNEPFEDTLDIADTLGYPNVGAPNVQIGTIGKLICKQLNVLPETNYLHNGVRRPEYFSVVHNITERGWELVDNLRKAIEQQLLQETTLEDYEKVYTEEASNLTLFKEGKLIQVFVNRYERDKKARNACLKIHGNKCIACKIDFRKFYGNDIDNIIHVHHVKPLSELKQELEKNVYKDLVPLCPNCHSVVHSTNDIMSIEELIKRVNKNKASF